MKEVFGKFRSVNSLKNIWNSKKRQLERAVKAKEVEIKGGEGSYPTFSNFASEDVEDEEFSSDESEIEYEDESKAGSFKNSIQFLLN